MLYGIELNGDEVQEVISAMICRQSDTREKLQSMNKLENNDENRAKRIHLLENMKEQERIYVKLERALYGKENDCYA